MHLASVSRYFFYQSSDERCEKDVKEVFSLPETWEMIEGLSSLWLVRLIANLLVGWYNQSSFQDQTPESGQCHLLNDESTHEQVENKMHLSLLGL